VFFLRWIAPAPAAAKAMIAVLSVGILGAAASLGLQGVNVLGLPLRDVAAWAPWKIALSTSLGPSLLVAIGAMGASIAALRTARLTIGRALSALALAGVGLSLAMSGHAATAPPQELMRPAMFLHGIGVAFWLGALVPLAVLVWPPQDAPLAALNRFSRMAIPAVGLLLLAGLALAIVQLESFEALVETKYGLILSIKLLLVAALLGLAALNRFRLVVLFPRSRAIGRPRDRWHDRSCSNAQPRGSFSPS
jgi:copper transport protein